MLKTKINKECVEAATICSQLKMHHAEISKTISADFEESKIVARDGGNIAGNALRELEERTGREVAGSKKSKIIG